MAKDWVDRIIEGGNVKAAGRRPAKTTTGDAWLDKIIYRKRAAPVKRREFGERGWVERIVEGNSIRGRGDFVDSIIYGKPKYGERGYVEKIVYKQHKDGTIERIARNEKRKVVEQGYSPDLDRPLFPERVFKAGVGAAKWIAGIPKYYQEYQDKREAARVARQQAIAQQTHAYTESLIAQQRAQEVAKERIAHEAALKAQLARSPEYFRTQLERYGRPELHVSAPEMERRESIGSWFRR